MTPREDIWEKLTERMERGDSYKKILEDLGLPEKYKAYISLMKRGDQVSREVQDEFAIALGLEPTLMLRYYRPTMARAWKPLLTELGMSVEEIVAQYVYLHWPQLWHMVPTPEEKGL